MAIKFNVPKPRQARVLINIGASFDIPTGFPVTGAKGETIWNGGIGLTTGVIGRSNNFKSSIMHYMMLSAADKIAYTNETSMHLYDTEVTAIPERLDELGHKFENLGSDIATREDPPLVITDKSQYAADEWSALLKDFLAEKEKSKDSIIDYTPFKDPNTKGMLRTQVPTFVEIDSLSEFEAGTTIEMLNKNRTDDSSTNTLFMRQALFKTKFLAELPRLTTNSNTFFFMTAHLGEEIAMGGGPYSPGPTKKLQFLKMGDKIKGVSDKFLFLMSNAWYASGVTVLKNQTTKLPEYPADNKAESTETELQIVRLTQLRSKSGISGYTLDIVVSQNEGVLPTLTEFHQIKTNGRFGISGSNISYNLDLLPEVKLGRTTVRSKIDNNPLLRRAINITSELAQLHKFHPKLAEEELLCTPMELYEDIKKLGYDWEILLNSRGWWTPNNYKTEIPFLSTMDLLKMRKERYVPYWYPKDKLKGDK